MKKQSEIGKRLQQVRYKRDYSVDYVAKQAGVSVTVIRHYENYGGIPGSVYLGKICKVLGISTDYAIYGEHVETVRRNEDVYIQELEKILDRHQMEIKRFISKTPSEYVKELFKESIK